MTLIAFALYGDHAEFLTDTASYTLRVEMMGKTTKAMVIHHLDTAVLTAGQSQFGHDIQSAAAQIASQVATHDELVDAIPEHARTLWDENTTSLGEEPSESVFFLIGWSARRDAFTAYAFASEDKFEPFEVTEPWVMPTPWMRRPSDLEHTRIAHAEADHPDVAKILDIWSSKPVITKPTSIDEWVDLGFTCRDQRSLSGGFGRVLVAGELIHTRLERGKATTQTVAVFNDEGEEFLQMVAFTQHPQAQVMPCWCDSGKRFLDCHLAEHLDVPCGCKSGQTFRQCCAVTAA